MDTDCVSVKIYSIRRKASGTEFCSGRFSFIPYKHLLIHPYLKASWKSFLIDVTVMSETSKVHKELPHRDEAGTTKKSQYKEDSA